MKLVIVESPNKIKKIRSFLGSGYRVGASLGHLRDLPSKGDLNVAFKNGAITPNYVVTKKDSAAQLKNLAQGVDEVLIATDPDREGEAIGWHIMQVLGKSYRYSRITFNQITKKAVLEALNKPSSIDMDLVNAQQARRVFDRVVGWVVSPTLRRGLGNKNARSAGRVQSTALRLVVERELAIREFDAKEYFEIEAKLDGKEKPRFSAFLFEWQGKKLEHRLNDQQTAEQVLQSAKAGPWSIASIERKQARSFAPAPFTTSTVQQAASVKLKMTPEQCMKALQALFEAGHITYHRTDSVSLSPEAIQAARDIIAKNYGDSYLPDKPNQHKSKVANAQEAHEAIRPTHPETGVDANGGIGAHADVYRLIWERYVASQMAAGLDDITIYNIVTASAADCLFRARGSVRVFDGWRTVGDDSTSEKKKDKDTILPKLDQGDVLNLVDLKLHKKSTKPPPRYTQASLIKELEKRGIGRPSTYASIMKTILSRKYIKELKRKLHATDLGIEVCQWLIEHYQGNFIEITYTSGMEERLDAMSRGEIDWQQSITKESELLVAISQKAGLNFNPLSGEKKAAAVIAEGVSCPKCKSKMRIIDGPHGQFYGCLKFPKCKGTLPMPGSTGHPAQNSTATQQTNGKSKPPAVTGNEPSCPLCQKPMRKRNSKHGEFWGCSQFPNCKGTRKIQESNKTSSDTKNSTSANKTKTANKQDPLCPECNSMMYFNPARNGKAAFYSCCHAPDCPGIRASNE